MAPNKANQHGRKLRCRSIRTSYLQRYATLDIP